jgi:hypothetical protein
MPETTIAATRTTTGVALTIYAIEGPIRVELRVRQALRLGLDLVDLAAEPLFTLRGGPEEGT